MVGQHHNGLAVGRNLYRACRDAVGQDVRAVFHLDGRPGQLAGHAVTVRSQLVHTMGKDVQASGGKSGILRAGHGTHQRKSLRTKCAHGMQGGGDTRILQGAVQMAGDDFLP